MAEAKESKRRFIISEKDWNTMQQYARISYDKDKNEISGITCLKKVTHPTSGESVWQLFDPVILKQENTGTTTELDGDALRDFYIKAGMKYGKDIRFCWWHSHHTMNAFWSGTDINEIKEWKNDSWSLALVINLFHEYKLNVHVWDPIEYSEDVRLEVLRNVPKATAKQLKEYDELCDSPAQIQTIGTPQPWYRNNNINQANIWDHARKLSNQVAKPLDPLASDDKLLWATHDNALHYSELIDFVIEEINDMMTEYALGKKDYKEYTEFVKIVNDRLKVRDARMKIKKIAKGKLLEATGTMEAEDHIIFNDDTTKEIYSQAQIQSGGWHYYGH